MMTANESTRISAIVPVLNEEARIDSCLRALRDQQEPLEQIILVDGGSTDATLDKANGLTNKIITAKPGRATQMNAGASAATGDVLWFIHADTIAPSTATRAMQLAVAAGALWGRFDIRLDSERAGFRIIERAINWRSRLSGMATGDQGIFVRRDCFKAVRGFPDIGLMEDLALSKLLKQQSRPACLKPPLRTSSRRWEQQGVWPTIWLMWRLRYAYWRGADPERLLQRYTIVPKS